MAARALSLVLLAALSPLSAQKPAAKPQPQQKPKDAFEAKVHDALEAARPALLDHLAAAKTGMAGDLALLCLAALHDQVLRDDRVLQAALNRLADAKPNSTYELALRLLVIEADSAFPNRLTIAKQDAAELLRHHKAGAFHYGPNSRSWDLSNSQYGALGLRAAAALGIEVPVKTWHTLADTVMEAQGSDGGFTYTVAPNARLVNGSGYLSMTVAGIAVLKICEQALTNGKRTIPEIDRRVDQAWSWIEKHVDDIGKPEIVWSFYAHYGLERAAILCDVVKVGQHDWYRDGAMMLLRSQGNGGGWRSQTDGYPGSELNNGRGQGVPTAFAVLFLHRKFQKVVGPVTGAVLLLRQLVDNTPDRDVDACVDELARRGKSAMVDVLEGVRDEQACRRRAAVAALRRIAGDDFGIDPAKTGDDNRDAVHRAELWYLKNR